MKTGARMDYLNSKLRVDYNQPLKSYLMGNLPTETAKPKEFALDAYYKEQLRQFFKETEELYGAKFNRMRFDVCFDSKGAMKLFEVNMRNPLGFATNAEAMKVAWNMHKEAEALDQLIIDIFKGKIAVLMESTYEFANSELSYMEKILKANGIKIIICSFEDVKKYINDVNYVIWYTKGNENNKESIKPFVNAKNCYGGAGYFENKADLTFENYPNSSLIMDGTEIVFVKNNYTVPIGKVAKIVTGERSSGGKGVFFGKEKFSVSSEFILLQDEFLFEFSLDINVLKINGNYEFICFQRFGGQGEKLANLSQKNGGYYQVLY